MKATLNGYGVLTITPENGLEEYALERWCNNYAPIRDEEGNEEVTDGESTLVISKMVPKKKKNKDKK